VVLTAALLGTSPGFGQEGWSRAGMRARAMVLEGEYETAAAYAEERSEYRRPDPQVVSAWLDARMALGEYAEAAELAAEAAATFDGYLPMLVQSIEVLRQTGHVDEAKALLEQLDALAKESNPKNLNAVELVALGRAALLLGAEPKLVLRQFYDPARKLEASGWGAAVATAELAVDKADYALASRVLNEARTRIGPLPNLLYLQARAHSPSDRQRSEGFLDEVLELNPRHLPALLLRAEHAIDVEDHARAREWLGEVWATNARHPRAWALEAAICYLLDEREKGAEARRKALEAWPENPEVDYRIGLKVSQMRRFAEGAEFLRRALEADPGHLASKKALGQDLLRLGRDEEGWTLIEEVQKADPYDVEVYNLMLLHDELEGFETLRSGDFVVRMRPGEAAVYGRRVMALLEDARRTLGGKYGFKPEEPVVVDFFPDQQDFAVRTLGIPGGLGILGACFGNVIAMNSPGSPAAMDTNWESTLWHEFCHTITLGATASRIPRWLTEGISVYEERQRDASCASSMSPEYRTRILAEDGLIPIAHLSAALTAFSDPETIGFAYYQASLLVEYFLEEFGEASLRRVLDDLRSNGSAGEVLARRMAGIEALDRGFARFARKRAEDRVPGADWTLPEPDSPLRRDPAGLADFLDEHPDNLWALAARGEFLVGEGRWEEARELGMRLVDLDPGCAGPGNGHALVAVACRNLGETEEERAALRRWAEVDGEASEAFLRLVELDLDAKDWEALSWSSRRVLSVNPMLSAPHHALGLAAEEQGETEAAIEAFETLLQLDPVNPAEVHYRLGRLHRPRDLPTAKRHVLLALEEAPRFRAAYGLLRDLDGATDETQPAEGREEP